MNEPLTYGLATAAERIGGVSERWLATQLRSGRIPGRKVGRQWRMTSGDIKACLDLFMVSPRDESVEHPAPQRKASTPKERIPRRNSAATTSAPTADGQIPLFPAR